MLDTNILVSAFVFQSKQIYTMTDHIVSNHELVLSDYVIDELRHVVMLKFPQKVRELDEFLTTLSFTLVYSPKHIPSGLFEIRDMCDAPILYTAILEGIDVLVTGDKDFDDVDVEKPVIMTVAKFIAEHIKPPVTKEE
ncbi:MAG: putative toxin-antitoxin system toxin component, PIN family [Oscillospiraceae bacterium]|jgi:putative PIN family toxin of toxin-antitoxin system|nr:putative toxin-antitoxin system toxin component, PIN family [Oscillospiraceae bacterium]